MYHKINKEKYQKEDTLIGQSQTFQGDLSIKINVCLVKLNI